MIKKKIIIEPELLLSLYWGNCFTSYKIADIFNCSKWTILNKMKINKIERRDVNCEEYRENRQIWNKGLTKETSDIIKSHSQKMIGRKLNYTIWNKNLTKETSNSMKIISQKLTGKTRVKGKDHPNWKGGITEANYGIRLKYTGKEKVWRNKIYERDKYTCQKCGVIGGKLNAHHIKYFANYPEYRYDINNGITLCVNCHKREHGWNFKEDNSRR